MAFEFDVDEVDGEGGYDVSKFETTNTPVQGVLSEAVKLDPNLAARKRQASRVTGTPEFAFDNTVDEHYRFMTSGADDLSKHPKTRTFLQDLDTAAIAQDDIPVLKAVEDWFDASKTFDNFGEVLQKQIGILGQGVKLGVLDSMDIEKPVYDVEGLRDVPSLSSIGKAFLFDPSAALTFSRSEIEKSKNISIQSSIDQISKLQSESKSLTPKDLNLLERGIRGGVESLAINTPAIAAAIVTRSPQLPLAIMGTQTYSSSYAKAREGGLSEDRSSQYAAVDAVVEIGTELLPTAILTKMFKGQTGFRQAATQFILGDQIGEQNATLLQSLNAYISGLDEELQNAKTLEEKIAIQVDRQAVTAVATLAAGGAQIGAIKGVQSGLGWLSNRANQIQAQTQEEQKALDQLDQLSTASTTQSRDADTYQQMFEGDSREVTIKRQALEEYLYSKKIEIESGKAPELRALQAAVDNTEKDIDEIAIPLGVFAANVAGTSHFEALKSDTKINKEGSTPNELEESVEQIRNRIDVMVVEADLRLQRENEARQVFESAKQQLVATEVLSEPQATAMAELVATWAAAYADRYGVSVSEAFEKSGFRVLGSDGTETSNAQGFYDPETNIIRLLKTSDASTFLHEFGHFMYEQEKRVGGDGDINDWFFATKEQVATEANRLIGNGIVFTKPPPALVSESESTERSENTESLPTVAGFDRISEEAPELSATEAVLTKAEKEQLRELENRHEILKKSETLQKALAKLGGLDRETWIEEGVDPEDFKAKVKVFGKPLFPKKGGMTADQVAEWLNETWYHGRSDYTANDAVDIVLDMLRDDPFVDLGVEAELEAISNAIDHIMHGNVYEQSGRRFEGVPEVSPEDVENYLDTGTTGNVLKDKVVQHATHELFARGFETYLLTGKAPTRGLRALFDKLATWLATVYRKVRSNLLVDISGGKEIYDRLLRSDDEINLAEIREGIEPLFTDAVMAAKANMTLEEFQKYQDRLRARPAKAKKTLRDKLIQEFLRPQQQWWADEKELVKDDLRAEVNSEPVHATRSRLKNGNVKLNRAEVKAYTGSKTVPKQFAGMTDNEGMSLAEMAIIAGYPSVEAMMEDLQNSPTLDQDLDQRAEQQMKQQHGDILNDGSIEQQADKALQSESRAKLIYTELLALRRNTKEKTVPRDVVKEIAKKRIRQLTYRQINPSKYRRAEVKASQKAALALRDNDLAGAASAKTQEMIFHYLAREAESAKKQALKISDRTKRYKTKEVKQAIIKAGEGYWEQIVKILVRFDFRKSVSDKTVRKTNEALALWAKNQNEIMGDEIATSPTVLDEKYVKHWKDVPLDDLIGIDETLKSIENAARNANKIQLENEQVELSSVISEFLESTQNRDTEFKGKKTTDKLPLNVTTAEGREGYQEAVKRWAAGGMAKMTKIPMLMKWIDGKDFGLLTRLVSVRLTEAQSNAKDLWKVTAKPISDKIDEHLRRHATRMYKRYSIPELGWDSEIIGHQMLAIMLNTGNRQNLRKMLLGEQWETEDKPEKINTDNAAIQAVMAQMTKDDMDLVQLIWDQMETLYQPLRDVSRRSSGVIPPKVESFPVSTPWGMYRGGYYPMEYDHGRGTKEQQAIVGRFKEQREMVTNSPFASIGSLNQSVKAGSINERTEFFAPIMFDMTVIGNHFSEVIHYITHHEAVRDLNRFFRNPTVKQEMIRVMGREEIAKILPWLNDIAKQGRSTGVQNFGQSLARRLRNGVTYNYLGAAISTVLIQPAGLLMSMRNLGAARVASAVAHMMKTMPLDGSGVWEARDFAYENSKVLKDRVISYDREIADAQSKLTGSSGFLDTLRRGSMMGMSYIQLYAVDMPTWHAAYEHYFEKTEDHDQSVSYADQVVKETQGSADPVDAAEILRGNNEYFKLFTMFMTYYSAHWNATRDLGRKATRGQITAAGFTAAALYLFVAPAIYDMIIRGDFDEDDAAEKLLLKSVTAPVSGIPLVRDAANSIISGYDYNPSPVLQLLEKGIGSGIRVTDKTLGDDPNPVSSFEAKNVFLLGSAALNLPAGSQAWKIGEHTYDVIKNGEDFSLPALWQQSEKDNK